MRRLIQLIVLGAFVFSCGGHWYILQAVAWVNMIRDYSQFVPLSEAVSMTLSGKYPCALCHALAEKQQNENDRLAAPEKSEKFFPPLGLTVEMIASSPLEYPEFSRSLSERTETPPTPPPRPALS